jgi:DNA-binding XRE family transcriptional regulator
MAAAAVSRLQALRRKSGLTQREVAIIIGASNDVQVYRHETGVTIPSFLIALRYSILYQEPISEIFPGLYESVREKLESGLDEFEQRLHQGSAKDRGANRTAQKLEWLYCRKNQFEIE